MGFAFASGLVRRTPEISERGSRPSSWVLLPIILGLTLLPVAGCSSFEQAVGTYQTDLGRAPTQSQLESAVRTHLSSFGFQLRESNANNVDTEWRVRSPGQTSRLQGIQRIRDRATIQYRQRAQSYYTAAMRVEFEALKEGQWMSAEIPSDVKDEYRRMQDRIRSELEDYMTQN